MRSRLAILSLALFLVSCGGSGTASADCKDQYWDGTVGVCLPTGWKVLDKETLESKGVPSEVSIAFQAEKAVSGQFISVTVTRETLPQTVDSKTYSQASIRAVSALPGYTLIDSRPSTVDEQEVEIHIFSAQPVPEEPARRFYQVSAVSGEIGYTFTAATPLSVSDALEKQILAIMRSVTFKQPAK